MEEGVLLPISTLLTTTRLMAMAAAQSTLVEKRRIECAIVSPKSFGLAFDFLLVGAAVSLLGDHAGEIFVNARIAEVEARSRVDDNASMNRYVPLERKLTA